MIKLLLLSVLLAGVSAMIQGQAQKPEFNAPKQKPKFNETENYMEKLSKLEHALDVFIGNGIHALGKYIASFIGEEEKLLTKIMGNVFQPGKNAWKAYTDAYVTQFIKESAQAWELLYQGFGDKWIDELDDLAAKYTVKPNNVAEKAPVKPQTVE